MSKFVAKFINKNIDLLNINKFCIIKTKKQLIKIKNKKNIIIRIEKTKTKCTRKNLCDFKYIDATIKILRCNKYIVNKNKKNSCSKAKQRKQKKLKTNIVIAIDIDIQIFNKNINKIYNNIRNIIIKQTIRTIIKKTLAIFAVFAIIKTTIKKNYIN